MKSLNLFASTTAALALSAGLAFADGHTKMVGGAEMFPDKNIVENAVNSADHTTLVAAVKAAGLVDTLSGAGPFTVFAPTNAAFDKLPAGTVETLLKPENKDQLTKILTCHVLGAEVMADAAMQMVKDDDGAHKVTMVGGCEFTVKTQDGNVTIEDGQGNVATVTIADVKQSNGVIHVIDTVLLPADEKADAGSGESTQMASDESSSTTSSESAMETKMVGGAEMFPNKNIVENAVNSADHTTLVAAVKAAGLVETLQGEGPFTVFAPVNSAFEALPAGTVDTLLKPENKGQLQKVLTAHVVAGKVGAEDLMGMIDKGNGYANITTVSGDVITARKDSKGVYIFDESGGVSRVTIADVNQSNGVIHVVDSVLVPK